MGLGVCCQPSSVRGEKLRHFGISRKISTAAAPAPTAVEPLGGGTAVGTAGAGVAPFALTFGSPAREFVSFAPISFTMMHIHTISASLRSRTMLLLLAIAGAALYSGCRSFEGTVQPIIDRPVPADYVPPVYVKGTKPMSEADPAKLSLEVWRINAEPYPDSVQLFVRVYDADHRLVTGLAPPYYTGQGDYRRIWTGVSERLGVGGSERPIEEYTVREFSDQDGIPYEISLVLDYSGTMGSSILALEDAAAAFVQMKRQRDRIAVVKFDTEPKLVSPPNTSTSDLVSKIKGGGLGEFGGYTALYAAVRLGSEQVASAPADHPRALVVFTDGEDNASAIAVSELYEYVRQNDIPIFTIAFGAINAEVLSDLSARTGGRFYQTYSAAEMRSAFEDIYTSLRNYYRVTYRPPFVPGEHAVEVALQPPGGVKMLSGKGQYVVDEGDYPQPQPPTLVNDTVYFEYNRSDVNPSMLALIERVVAEMQANPRLKIEVQGHTDSKGGEKYNIGLSERRANAVRTAIIERGIAENRVRARGFGLSRPAANNQTEEGRRLNRRATFVVIAQ